MIWYDTYTERERERKRDKQDEGQGQKVGDEGNGVFCTNVEQMVKILFE
jgi:hypothetical protein